MTREAKYAAHFRCISGCSTEIPLDEIIYTCPVCGNLLEVRHDTELLRRVGGERWRQIFDERIRRWEHPYMSGIWSKREIVLPDMSDDDIITTGEGYTSLLQVKRYAALMGLRELYIKQCGNTHTGSFKDLGMTVLVSQVNRMRKRKIAIRAVAAASTGDTSAALSAYAALADIPAVVFLPNAKVSMAQLIQPIANGALVLSIDTDFDGCMKIVRSITSDRSIYLANSMNSLRIEGQKTISIEICQQLGWRVPDWIVIPGGNLGNVSALGNGFRLMRDIGMIDHLPRIAVAQSQNANPLYLAYQKGLSNFRREDFTAVPARDTLASAIRIGNPVSIEKAVRTLIWFNGVVEQASESEIANVSARADRTGLFNCPHTGVALVALEKLVRKNVIRPEDCCVVISTAHGLKFSDQKVRYHSSELPDIFSQYANPPIHIPNDEDKVRGVLRGKIPGFS